MNTESLRTIAYTRGKHKGEADKEVGFYNDAPLSGEWAGESVQELLGDLIRTIEELVERGETITDDVNWFINDLCDSYESGYHHGWHHSSVPTATN